MADYHTSKFWNVLFKSFRRYEKCRTEVFNDRLETLINVHNMGTLKTIMVN